MDSILFLKIARMFAKLHQEQPVIVYDVDDILWPLIHYVAKRGGIDPARSTAIYSIYDNPQLTRAEQDYLVASFAEASVFENIPFYPGTAEILRPQELGAIVKINSNSFSERIAELKTMQLLAAIPGLKPEQIQMNIIDHSNAHRKPLDPTTTVLIDDSPKNVRLSPALINVMPRNITWSYCADAVQTVCGKRVVWKPNLLQINQFVYQLTACIMRGGPCRA